MTPNKINRSLQAGLTFKIKGSIFQRILCRIQILYEVFASDRSLQRSFIKLIIISRTKIIVINLWLTMSLNCNINSNALVIKINNKLSHQNHS